MGREEVGEAGGQGDGDPEKNGRPAFGHREDQPACPEKRDGQRDGQSCVSRESDLLPIQGIAPMAAVRVSATVSQSDHDGFARRWQV